MPPTTIRRRVELLVERHSKRIRQLILRSIGSRSDIAKEVGYSVILGTWILFLALALIYVLSWNASILAVVAMHTHVQDSIHGLHEFEAKEYVDTFHVIIVFFEIVLGVFIFLLERRASKTGFMYVVEAPNSYWLKIRLKILRRKHGDSYYAIKELFASTRYSSVLKVLIGGAFSVLLYIFILKLNLHSSLIKGSALMILGAILVVTPLIIVVYRTLELPARQVQAELIQLFRVGNERSSLIIGLLVSLIVFTSLYVILFGFYHDFYTLVSAQGDPGKLYSFIAFLIVFPIATIALLILLLNSEELTQLYRKNRFYTLLPYVVIFLPSLFLIGHLVVKAIGHFSLSLLDYPLHNVLMVSFLNIIIATYYREAGYTRAGDNDSTPINDRVNHKGQLRKFYELYVKRIVSSLSSQEDEEFLEELILLTFYHVFLEVPEEGESGERSYIRERSEEYYIDNTTLLRITSIIEKAIMDKKAKDLRYIVLYTTASLICSIRLLVYEYKRREGYSVTTNVTDLALSARSLYDVGQKLLDASIDEDVMDLVIDTFSELVAVKSIADEIISIRHASDEEKDRTYSLKCSCQYAP